MSYLSEYPFLEQLGAVVIYVAGQLWMILLSVIGDPIISFGPSCALLAAYLFFYLIFQSYTLLRVLLSYFKNKKIRCLINIRLQFRDPRLGLF